QRQERPAAEVAPQQPGGRHHVYVVARQGDLVDPGVGRADRHRAAGLDADEPLLSTGQQYLPARGDRSHGPRIESLDREAPERGAEEALPRPDEQLARLGLLERAHLEPAPARARLFPVTAAAAEEAAALQAGHEVAAPRRERAYREPG